MNKLLESHYKKQIKLENKKYANADEVYKSRQSFINKEIHRKATYIPVSNNKDEKKSFVDTKKYASLKECMQDNSNWNYMASGKNSLQRELFIVECDEPWLSSIEETVEKWEEIFGFQPSYFREHLTNGHYQIGLFLEKPIDVFKIKRDGDGNLYLEEQELYHKRWLTATRLASYILNMDMAFVGYNAQNPYCEKEGYKAVFFPFSEAVSFELLYKKLMSHAVKKYGDELKSLSPNPALMSEYEVQRLIEANALWNQNSNPGFKKNVMFEDEHNKKIESLTNKMNEVKNKTVSHSLYDVSYDKKIFVTTTRVVNRWRKCLIKKNPEHTNSDLIRYCNSHGEEIISEVMKNIELEYGYTGYTHTELRNRIIYDVKCLFYKNTVDWDKVGFTYIQNELSKSVRKQTKSFKMKHAALICSTLSDYTWDFSYRDLSAVVSDKLKLIYDIDMKASSLNTFLCCYKNSLMDLNLDRHDVHEIFRIFNDFMDCDYYFYKVNKKNPFKSNANDSSDVNAFNSFKTNHLILKKNNLELDDNNHVFYKKTIIGEYNTLINDYMGKWLYGRLVRGYRVPRTRRIPIFTVRNLVDSAMA